MPTGLKGPFSSMKRVYYLEKELLALSSTGETAIMAC